MQNSNSNLSSEYVEIHCILACDEETAQKVVFELVVPVAAKVPAPCQRIAVAKLVVREASSTSTGRGESLALFWANNTALGAVWCISATLVAQSG